MRIAIIGFGFSGLMAATNLIRHASDGLTLYIIDEKMNGRGTAYSTTNPDHLLNVPASNMSAFADAPEHLVQWLETHEAAAAKAALKVTKNYTAQDFIPRALYGAYLASTWQAAQVEAGEKHLSIKLVPTTAVAITKSQEIAVLTERGDAIAVDKVILAAGHEPKVIYPHLKSTHFIQDIWAPAALDGAKDWASPVMLMGSGLTAIDMVQSLRRAEYAGEIIIASHRGLLPRVHAPQTAISHFNETEIAAHKSISSLLHLLHTKIRECGDWRAVFDALRPHTQALWQHLTTRDQRRFLKHLAPLWSVHRHRMAPEIKAVMDEEVALGKTYFVTSRQLDVTAQENITEGFLVDTGAGAWTPSHILNCTGLELNLARSSNALLKQLLADGVIEAHPTGLGIAADKNHRAWGTLYPQLTVIGSLLTGQLLESTAVPELRTQAQAAAR